MSTLSEHSKEDSRDGIAKIKPEFIVKDHKRTLSIAYISDKDKAEYLDNTDNEPPKKKLKGQNKRRPREARIPRNEKFCPCLIDTGECSYGDSCYYLHDSADYLSKKPADIKSDCHLFKTYGKCPYGITCRFGSQHIDVDGKNIIDVELQEKCKDRHPCQNALTKQLQFSLRRKRYDFKTSLENIKIVERRHKNVNVEVVNQSAESLSGNGPDDLKQSTINKEDASSVILDTKPIGSLTDEDLIKLRIPEIKKVDFSGKLYLAPLTTVGNLPFRRICKRYGADITCGEMAVSMNLLQGQQSEWALIKRHETEDLFGVQISGAHADLMTRCTQVLCENATLDFIDINVGCPIDLVYKRGGGCALMSRTRKLHDIMFGMRSVANVPITAKIRTGIAENKNTAHLLLPHLRDWGASLVSIHGRSREQRYTKSADWDYIKQCAEIARPMPLFGNGDVLTFEDYYNYLEHSSVDGIMIGRGALFKPWIFTEIKERRYYDISSKERFGILQDYVNYGLEHWGADSEGVEKTRRFLLEWLSFLYRYIPVGVLEILPQKINDRPPCYMGRDDLETLMASSNCADWIKISEMLLGPVPSNFSFLPKHKANSYQ